MSNSGNSTKYDTIRVMDFGSITNAYQALGGVFLRDAFKVSFKNNTDVDMSFTNDGTNEKKRMPGFSGDVGDEKTDDMYMASGTQWSIKYTSDAPTQGWVALEVQYV